MGFNTMLLGSGLADEAQQAAWLEETMAGAGGRKIAWFTHRPLFIDDAGEGDTGYWSVKPGLRSVLLERLRHHEVALVATGHVHRSHDHQIDGCRFIWGASSGFVVGPENQPPMPGEGRLGAVLYDFEGPEVAIRPSDVPGLTTFCIDDLLHEVYPPRQAA